ncbi:hypothetical protein H6G25_16575 [Dolichospermum sp. FACHB-1091]|nr:hypothetical protein [Dolichospermum sp. FACHB-1091]MBD2444770.1 hypothetical protein [Dolichospermum sp. FACHB-1091]
MCIFTNSIITQNDNKFVNEATWDAIAVVDVRVRSLVGDFGSAIAV